MASDGLKDINYIVTIDEIGGRCKIFCNTEDEAWNAVGKASFAALYQVESPTGKDVSDFIPY